MNNFNLVTCGHFDARGLQNGIGPSREQPQIGLSLDRIFDDIQVIIQASMNAIGRTQYQFDGTQCKPSR